MPRVTSVSTPVAHLVGPGKLKVVNGRLAYAVRDEPPLRLDPERLQAVYCYGPVGVTDEAMQVLFARGIEVSWLSPAGTRFRGRLVRSDPSATTLRLLQYRRLTDPARQRDWAAAVVAGKIDSQVQAARHYQRQGEAAAGETIRQLRQAAGQVPGATLEQLRGLEGTAAAAWFRLLGQVLRPPWGFEQRNRRPPRDPVNALLSLGYTWVLARASARCQAAGLELNLGGLHEYRPGRPSLACDLMEPVRVPGVDRWVIGVCNQQRVTPEQFEQRGEGIFLKPGVFPVILSMWEEHWQTQAMEELLDGWIARLAGWLRQGEPAGEAPGGRGRSLTTRQESGGCLPPRRGPGRRGVQATV